LINNSYLLALYGGASNAALGGGYTPPAPKTQPTPPWSSEAVAAKPDALVRAALGGRNFIDESSAKLDMPGSSADYRKLFSLYQGLQTLSALTNRSNVKGVSANEQAQLSKSFAAGLAEISAYMSGLEMKGVNLVQGTTSVISKTTAAVAKDSTKTVTGAIHEGKIEDPVAAFAGETRFNITIKTKIGSTTINKAVAIDLDEMGSTPRTMDAVVAHINGKLEAAGVTSRMGRELIPATPKTITAGGKTITLPAGADKWALSIKGTSAETIGFTADKTSDAVYVVQGAGTAGGHQLLKFQSDGGDAAAPTGGKVGETWWVDGRLSQTALPPGVSAVRASAVGPDGSLWIVGDIDAGSSNQPIKGQQDVALMKYDSSGRLVASRALGAASTASGYAIAIDADGRVAVAGSVTGALDGGNAGTDAKLADSFVTVFNADAEELWTQRRGARAADEATSVSFGDDGMVYVAGRAKSGVPGASGLGGWDGYLQTFTETKVHDLAPIKPVATAAAQFGTAGDDGVSAMVVDGSNIYTAGVENGRAVVRQFTLNAAGAPTLAATRDLGAASGDIAGIAVSNGKVILTGATKNANLGIDTVNKAHSGGTDVYVAVMSADLAASPDDRLTYYGGAGDDTAADVKVHDGKVWITGIADRPIGAKATDPTQAYLTRIDPLTGAVEYNRTWQGDGQQAAPMTLAISSGGASVLDRIGLPQGDVDNTDSKLLTAATSLRVGDQFSISPPGGGRAVVVTIEAKDTLQTLASKIERASQNKLKVTIATTGASTTGKDGETVLTTGGFQSLSIASRDGKSGAVINAGPSGRDALAGLGLSSGLVGGSKTDKVKTFGLDLPLNLSLGDAANNKTVLERLEAALRNVREAYRSLGPQQATSSIKGTVPTYLKNQLANYQAALDRLTA